MRIKQCIHHRCTDFSVHESQLCEKHLKEHLDRCKKLQEKDNAKND